MPRFGSLVQSDDVTELPFGVASDVRNCRFRAQSVGPRDGTSVQLRFGAQGNSIGGFGVLRYLAPDNSGDENIQIIAATQVDGNLWAALPFQQGSVTLLTTAQMLAAAGLQPAASMGIFAQCSQAYNKMLIARGNGMTGVLPPLIVDGATLSCDQISDKPFGDTWLPGTAYRTGQVVSPTVNGTILYYCLSGGISAATEPVWPQSSGGTVVDGGITWRYLNIVCSSGLQPPAAPIASGTAAGTAIPAGATVFLACTWVNQFGESTAVVVNPEDGTAGNILQWKNTTGAAVNLNVVLPVITPEIAVLPPQYAVTGINVYGYLVTGTPDSTLYLDPTSYAFLGSGAAGSTFTVSTAPTGNQIPTSNTAFTTPDGNVSSGVRYMIVLYETRTGYICGFSAPAPVRCDISADGRKMLVQNLPIGPYNCVARICAFTVAGQSSAGPYFYIDDDDYVDPGVGEAKIKQTATKIPDNITTSAYFDFLDSYLPGASEVTDYFDRIEVPPVSDIYYSKVLDRVCYTGAQNYPSAVLISDVDEDAEAIRVPGSILQVAQTSGDRAVCVRDFGNQALAYKENSAFAITPNDGDPSDWGDGDGLWEGSGPCGPRAIDVAFNDEQKLHAYAHRTGGYAYLGNGVPKWLTKELTGTPDDPGVWDQINWSRSYLISVAINLQAREIYFHVPLNTYGRDAQENIQQRTSATVNNARITVNYQNGFDDPIVFVVRTGREVPNITGRKWSVDSIAANDCKYVPQRTSAS